ncbi:hypothetical protein ACPVPU_05005 [Sphingomonas sp. CJ99]
MMAAIAHPDRAELVEALSFSAREEGQGFDKLSPNGFGFDD